MFEHYSFENILQEMLDEVGQEFDVSETSPIYTSFAASATQVAKVYRFLERVVELGFASTSEDEYLEKRTSELGVFYKPATTSVRRGIFNIPIPIGSRFFVQDLYFAVLSNEEEILLECETPGVIGNTIPVGTDLLPVENIYGLETAVLGEVLVPGAEKEMDTSLYGRYQKKIAEPATSGNIYHYYEWVGEIDGVGAAKVFPNWDGPDTVKVVIVDNDYYPASNELVRIVQMELDPVPGQGEGKAPVGAFVTAESAVALIVDVSATIEIASSTTIENIQLQFEQNFSSYLKSIAFKDDVDPIVRHRLIGSFLLSIPGVVDYSTLLVNGQIGNIILGDNETPIIGQVIFNV
ncbi:baseplate J/gp47 family protein [Peribacillus loiseleuriae]|uniref:baseplate J/gp47 family protein n=1 Tax=Peribacillus loiseleuriae TaxID=1679170 RepID=UPI003D05E064